jgi:hypothetical protein
MMQSDQGKIPLNRKREQQCGIGANVLERNFLSSSNHLCYSLAITFGDSYVSGHSTLQGHYRRFRKVTKFFGIGDWRSGIGNTVKLKVG